MTFKSSPKSPDQSSPKSPHSSFAIEIKHLTMSYGKHIALLDISCRISKGKVVGIMGPNGAGKSTLLKSILGLLPSTDMGRIYIQGKPLNETRYEISYVPQRKEIDLHYPITVEEMVLLGRYHLIPWWRGPSLQDRQSVEEAIHLLKLKNYQKAPLSTLSGGLLQRAFVARAFAQKANILLLDEPFVGMDIITEKNLIETIQLAKKAGKTLIIVHHDMNNITDIFDEIILVNQRIYTIASPQIILKNQKLLQEVYSS